MADNQGFFRTKMFDSSKAAGMEAHSMHVVGDNIHYLIPMQMSRKTLNALQHYTSGRGLFVPTQMPAFLEEKFSKETNFFRRLLLSAVTRIEWTVEKTAEVGTVETGIEGQAKDYVSKTGGVPREATFTFPAEFDGGFLTTYIGTWIEGTQSVRDGVVHLYGYDGPTGPASYSMEGIYFTMDPSERYVVYSSFGQNMFPKSAQFSIFNTTKGEFNHQEVSIPFTNNAIDGDGTVHEAAQKYLDALNTKRNHSKRLLGDAYHVDNKVVMDQSGNSVISRN